MLFLLIKDLNIIIPFLILSGYLVGPVIIRTRGIIYLERLILKR